ncbi:hypothetical protein CCYA_CCYA10G2909 [Cyanidiococcus yangmingshanensis]|nr:hypothetical protein CCYA_CCYA10G2909 [Cyanidiococcus yangmingshanensis]
MSRASGFVALQCSACELIQVQKARQDGKFRCKVCGEWQSIQRVLARASRPQDIRAFVQAENRARGEQRGSFHGFQWAGSDETAEQRSGASDPRESSCRDHVDEGDRELDNAILKALHEPNDSGLDEEITRALRDES